MRSTHTPSCCPWGISHQPLAHCALFVHLVPEQARQEPPQLSPVSSSSCFSFTQCCGSVVMVSSSIPTPPAQSSAIASSLNVPGVWLVTQGRGKTSLFRQAGNDSLCIIWPFSER